MQTDAAVRRRTAKVRDLVAAVDGVTTAEEDRVRHRRPVVLAGKPFARQPFGPVAAVRRPIASACRRNGPLGSLCAVDFDRETLRRLVDGDYDLLGPRRGTQQNEGDEGKDDAWQVCVASKKFLVLVNIAIMIQSRQCTTCELLLS